MLYKVEARNPQGDLFSLQFDDISDGYIVEEIGGLDPVKATIVSSSFAQQDGTHYQSSRRENRNITMKVQMDPIDDGSVESLRERLYDFFMPKMPVSLRFYRDSGLTVDIDGRVESCEAPLFTDEPEANISIINFNPDFVDMTPVVVTGLNTSNATATNVDYKGSVNTGIVLVVSVAHTMSDVTIYQTTPSGQLYTMEFAGSLVAGDVLTISTLNGNKYATLTRAGVDSSVLYGISPQSKWLELEKGINAIQVYATDGGSPATITYLSRYGGL